jgi:uncharacterized membrane protein YdbT with pleckstrin-like domain
MKLHDDERLLHELRPQGGLLVIWVFTKCIPAAFAAAVLSGVLLGIFAAIITGVESGTPFQVGTGVTAAGILPLLVLVLTFVYCVFLRRSYVYYITNQRCVFHGGILRRVERSVPYHKITDVEISQHIGERILRIARVQLFTPGTGSMMASPFGGQQRAEISFIGLRDSETPADTINSILSKFRSTGE